MTLDKERKILETCDSRLSELIMQREMQLESIKSRMIKQDKMIERLEEKFERFDWSLFSYMFRKRVKVKILIIPNLIAIKKER